MKTLFIYIYIALFFFLIYSFAIYGIYIFSFRNVILISFSSSMQSLSLIFSFSYGSSFSPFSSCIFSLFPCFILYPFLPSCSFLFFLPLSSLSLYTCLIFQPSFFPLPPFFTLSRLPPLLGSFLPCQNLSPFSAPILYPLPFPVVPSPCRLSSLLFLLFLPSSVYPSILRTSHLFSLPFLLSSFPLFSISARGEEKGEIFAGKRPIQR